MKILMVVLHFPPAVTGGAERQCLRQAEALVKRGHDVTILTGWWMFSSARREIVNGVVIRRVGWLLPLTWQARKWHARLKTQITGRPSSDQSVSAPQSSSPRSKKFRWMMLAEYPGLFSFFAETYLRIKFGLLKADVVHVHESHWIAGFARWISLKLGVPVLCKEATSPPLKWGAVLVPWEQRWKQYREECHFIALTSEMASQLKKMGIPAERVRHIPNGIELPTEIAHPNNHEHGIYVGNFTQTARRKAFDILIAAAAEAVKEEPGLRIRLHGRGDTSEWRQFAQECGATKVIEFAGESMDVGRELQKAAFFVLPSRMEGLSNALLEAMAAGLPVIVSDIPANTEVVRDRIDGLVVPVEDVRALADAILELYRNPDLRARLGKSARMRITESFAIQRVAEQLEQAYRQVSALAVVNER